MPRKRGITGGIHASRVANAQVNEELVRTIRRFAAAGTYSIKELAKMYNLGKETVARIVRRDTWAWVEDVNLNDVLPEDITLSDAQKSDALASQERLLRNLGMIAEADALAQGRKAADARTEALNDDLRELTVEEKAKAYLGK